MGVAYGVLTYSVYMYILGTYNIYAMDNNNDTSSCLHCASVVHGVEWHQCEGLGDLVIRRQGGGLDYNHALYNSGIFLLRTSEIP